MFSLLLICQCVWCCRLEMTTKGQRDQEGKKMTGRGGEKVKRWGTYEKRRKTGGRAKTRRGEEGGAEGRLSKTRTGNTATMWSLLPPPHSTSPFFQSCCVVSKLEIQGSLPKLKSLIGWTYWVDSFVWFLWKLTKKTWWPESCAPHAQRNTMIAAYDVLKIQQRGSLVCFHPA